MTLVQTRITQAAELAMEGWMQALGVVFWPLDSREKSCRAVGQPQRIMMQEAPLYFPRLDPRPP